MIQQFEKLQRQQNWQRNRKIVKLDRVIGPEIRVDVQLHDDSVRRVGF